MSCKERVAIINDNKENSALIVSTGCPKNGVLTVHYGVEEITVNVRKMLKKFYWTYLLIWRSLKVAFNTSIILKYMYEIVMTATSNRTYYHKVQDHSLPIQGDFESCADILMSYWPHLELGKNV
jgi:hypothetical protein